MTIAKGDVDFVSAPRDYAELHSRYYAYLCALAKKSGITESNKEDVVSDILFRLMEKGFLDDFNPNLVFTYDGQQRPARFKNFLSNAFLLYLRGQRDKQSRHADREQLILDKPTSYQEIDSTYTEWFGINAEVSHEDDIIGSVDGIRLFVDIRAYLGTIPRRSAYDKCDLVLLFDTVLDHLARFGEVRNSRLREHFGISGTGMNGWMWWLRANIADYLQIPLPPKRERHLP